MATQKFINNYRSALSATYGPMDLTFTVDSAEGLPILTGGDWYYLTLFNLVGVEESGHEVVKVTGQSGMVLTATRGIEGAEPTTFLAGTVVAARLTAGSLAAKADQTEVALKANAADVYTKSQVYTKTEVDTIKEDAKNTVIGGAPTALSTLDALAAAINDDPNFYATLTGLLNLKAALNSPAFTGTPTVPTAGTNDNTTKAASTAFVMGQIAILLNSAPGALDTLGELSAAINNDPAFFTTMNNALALKAPLASPALTGVPTAPTAALGTNTTQVATMAAVQAAIANLLNSAPGALDTLNELAAAIGNDPNFATTITNSLATKAAKGANNDITSLTGLTTALSAPQGGTGQSTYAVGDLLYSGAADSLAKLAGNTTTARKFLSQTGNGSVSAAPVWNSLVAADIPNLDWTKITSGVPTTIAGFGITNAYTKTEVDTALAGKQASLGFTPVQQGGGTGQGTNKIYIGWGNASGGLKVTVDSTDQGFVPFSSTLPSSGTLTFGQHFNIPSASFKSSVPTVYFDETDQVNAPGLWRMVADGDNWFFDKNTAAARNFATYTRAVALSSVGAMTLNGGGLGNLSSGGMLQLGASSYNNVVFDYQTFQARNNGSASQLNLNYYGGGVMFGGASANNCNITVNGAVSATNGMSITGSAVQLNGGSPVAMGSGNGYLQIGSTGGNNIVFDSNTIQARNNGATNTLTLNANGGTVNHGGAVTANGDIASNASVVAQNLLYAKNPGTWMKVVLQDGNSAVHGYIGADVNSCLVVVDKNNSAYRFFVDNSGNATAGGNLTAYSDETLKKDWTRLYEGDRITWLKQFSEVIHGDYTRVDTGERQSGAGAQSMRRLMPLVVHESTTKEGDTILSLDYGKAALVSGMETAAEVVALREEVEQLKALVRQLMGSAA